ncbi:lantibiotic dehydratase [Streptomyces sp. NPDC048638]|uniref:lantibiotic dehydratase n=1 Tax=Streptomyces sp. NPDC048638 TaxID=3365580 RepID=UPI003722D345
MLRLPLARLRSPSPDTGGKAVEEMSSEQMVEFIRAAVKDPQIREAISVSAPSLSDLVDRIVDGLPVKRSQLGRALLSVSRYLIRARSRSTPFGILAGVAPVRFTERVEVSVGTEHVKHVRVDGAWLTSVVQNLECRPEIVRGLKLIASDLRVVKGDRLHIPVYESKADAARWAPPRIGQAAVRMTSVLRRTLEAAAQPISYSDLFSLLCESFPMAAASRIEALIVQLIRQNILLTDLHPPLDSSDPLDHVLNRLPTPVDQAIIADLHQLREKISAYQATGVGEGCAELDDAARTACRVNDENRPFFQVDLRSDARVSLPESVADEAALAVSALWRMSPVQGEISDALSAYHERFLNHYEPGTNVPLLDLLDPERGLGLPEGYSPDKPQAEHRPAHRAGADDHNREAVLAELALTAIERRGREVVLSDDTVNRLDRKSTLPPTPTAEACVQLFADSIDMVESGEYTLALGALGGSWQTGAMFGRFAHLLPELDQGLRRGMVHGIPDGAVAAQLSYRSGKAVTANVVKSPQWADRSISIGEFGHEGVPPLRAVDVLVGASQDRFHLMSAATGGDIAVVVPNMLNPEGVSTPPARFLREVASSGHQGWYGWEWGIHSRLPHLPRVRYRRTILCPERWRPTSAMVESAGDWEKWREAMSEWRDRYEVPREIRVCADDRQLILDLIDPMHQRILHDEIRRMPHARIEEPLVDGEEGTGWLQGYVNELVIPLKSTVTAPASMRLHRPVATPPVPKHRVGGEWLYVKIYTSFRLHDEVLAEHLPSLVNSVQEFTDRWFFIRYSDPDPHLRIRFHGDADRLLTDVLPGVRKWAERLRERGVIREWNLDSYEPEFARYGGLDVMESAEQVFQADSEFALAQLQLLRAKRIDFEIPVLTALNFLDICHAMLPGGWASRLVEELPRDEHREAFRGRRSELRALVANGWDTVAPGAEAGVLADLRKKRDSAVVRYRELLSGLHSEAVEHDGISHILQSLLHMHHNRFVGIDRESEGAAHAIARGMAELIVSRERYGR